MENICISVYLYICIWKTILGQVVGLRRFFHFVHFMAKRTKFTYIHQNVWFLKNSNSNQISWAKTFMTRKDFPSHFLSDRERVITTHNNQRNSYKINFQRAEQLYRVLFFRWNENYAELCTHFCLLQPSFALIKLLLWCCWISIHNDLCSACIIVEFGTFFAAINCNIHN